MKHTTHAYKPVDYYYVADPSYWPLFGSLGIFSTVLGIVNMLHNHKFGIFLAFIGILLLAFTIAGWFGAVIKESVAGLHSKQMDRSYRWGMVWFIVSEVALFSIFFIALFYTRVFSVPDLGGDSSQIIKDLWMNGSSFTHKLLWPQFKAVWPLLSNPNPTLFPGPQQVMETWGIPAINTFILLSSGVTVTWAHWGLKKNHRKHLVWGLVATVALGLFFISMQANEYYKAFNEYSLSLHSGIYGSTFYMLTGLHAMHVTMGVIMLTTILMRCIRGHFVPEHHFAFEAVAWYWHFVDVVWLFLFLFVYWL
ncbi:MAG TPA: cytochrome c oxidase subunit 3 [Gammaproteobacteria bacterium]|nr:cytochrome c oxidase subunit 3 [Gammaproteobacteria bacterium]